MQGAEETLGQAIHSLQEGGLGAVVGLQPDGPPPGPGFHLLHEPRKDPVIRVAEAVDGLLAIPHHRHRGLSEKPLEDLPLDGVGVLVLVHQKGPPACPVGLQHRGVIQGPQSVHLEVGEVQDAVLPLAPLEKIPHPLKSLRQEVAVLQEE